MHFFLSSTRTLLRSRPLTAGVLASMSFGTACFGTSALGSNLGPTMLQSSASGPTPTPFVRLVTYNVLSSHLCEPTHYIACKPEDLDPATRLARLKTLLEPQCEGQAVICLQEVSTQWVGELTPFFEERGYTFVTGNYGNAFNGFMGVSLAWPKARFTSEEVAITRVADTKPWPKAPKKEPKSKWAVALGGAWASLRTLWAKPTKPPFDVWHETKRRSNFMVSARLKCKKSSRTFAVSTYHMPCLFGSDEKVQVMTNHASLVRALALEVRRAMTAPPPPPPPPPSSSS